MFKTFFHTLVVFSLVGATSSLAFAGDATKFIIEAPKTAILDEAVDITIKAVDNDGTVDTNYSGSIIFMTNHIGDAVPMPGRSIKFESENAGVYKFTKGVTFKNTAGKRRLFISDVDGKDIFGMTRISVSKSESSTETSKSSTKDTKSPAEDSKSSKKIQSTKVSTSLSLEQNYNMWKLIHQSVADKGFEWAAPTSHYLDGNMPKNTNFVSVQNAMLQEYLQELIKEGSTAQDRKYDSCIFDALSQKTLSTKILRSTAKSCAKSAYGTYFTGKEYTTREEVLMLLSRYYNTPYAIQGVFLNGAFTPVNSDKKSTSLENIHSNIWYAPFTEGAVEIGYLSSGSTWKAAKKISNTEITLMNMLYKNKYQVRKKISTTEETSTSEDKEVSNEVSTFLEEILKINTDTSSTPSVSEQKDTIVKALAIYYEIKGKYPDSLKDLKDTPIYNPNTQQYESMTLDNIKLFETNFTYSKTATLYSLTQK